MRNVPVLRGHGSPFRLSSMPHEAFAHAEWTRVEQRALISIANREHLLMLGQPGTGKSLLLRSLNQTLKAQGISVRQLRSDDPLEDLASDDVLLVDEAELLSAAKSEQILRLSNPIVMAGLPNLPERFSICLATFHCVTFEPLPTEDVARFVVARLVASERPRDTFTPEALAALVCRSGGLFRLIIILAGAAMFLAEQRGAAKVTIDDVADAESMRAVLPEETAQPTTFNEMIADTKPLSESAVLQGPTNDLMWLEPFAARTRYWSKTAGVSAFLCASLAVIVVAVITARTIRWEPTLPIQEVQSRSMPPVVSSAMPDLALSSPIQLARSAPVQVAAGLPLNYAETTSPLALAPTTALEAEPHYDAIPQQLNASTSLETRMIPIPPSAVSNLAETTATTLTFTGPILNNTMGQGGQLSLELHIRDAHGSVAGVFQASQGLIGSGVLTGEIQPDGLISLSGRLMMGRNPFNCLLEARLDGKRLIGVATFVRSTSGAAAHSSFKLSRL